MKNFTINKKIRSYPSFIIAVVMIALSLTMFLGMNTVQAALTSQMDFGAQSSDVSELQTYLSRYSNLYPSGLVTGYFGSLTQGGVEKFQIEQSIVSNGNPESTGYGRVGPVTGARINVLMASILPSRSTPSGDVWSPMISGSVLTTDTNSATIRWNTSESAVSRVMYAKNWPFSYATAQSVSTGTYVTKANITISDLDSDTMYYYIRESIDHSGNVTWTSVHSFRTEKN
jgi:peptidoglycan hydrolase-like protein with peptidoglycan-binding domain